MFGCSIVAGCLVAATLPLAATAAPAAAQSDRQADLDALETQFLAVDRSFSLAERARAEARLAELRVAAADLGDAGFELAVAALAALADNGHTAVYPGRWADAFDRLAVRFLLADDGLYVADATPEFESLVGARVREIDGHDLDALRATWARYYPRPAGARDEAMHVFLESPELLRAAGIAGPPHAVELSLDGRKAARVGTTGSWPHPEGIFRFVPQARGIELAVAGRIAGDPLYLRDPSAVFRFVELPEHDAAYVQFRANHGFGAGDVRAEATAAIERLRALGPRFVIVDQRFNFGGDLNNTRELMQAIPDLVGPDGHVVAIVSGRTFSAGIASLGYLKQAGGDRVTIVGAPIGDRLEFWAEGSPIVLPGSGTVVGVATERHNYVTGCPEADCHGSIRRHPIAVPLLEPDVRPELTYADVVAGRDPYLEAALTLIGN